MSATKDCESAHCFLTYCQPNFQNPQETLPLLSYYMKSEEEAPKLSRGYSTAEQVGELSLDRKCQNEFGLRKLAFYQYLTV